MKKVKSPPAPKPATDQLTLDAMFDKITSAIELHSARINMINARIDVLLTDGIGKPIAPKPTLKWFEQEPLAIDWCVCCDPARLVLTPGTTLRYNIDDAVITTYDGVTIGELNSLGHNIICEGVKQGAKVHVYLTTSRKLGIKLGRPA